MPESVAVGVGPHPAEATTPAPGDGVAIEVRDLRKRYGEVRAVDGVDLTVRTGEVFALLGPNGAGKTTAVEMLEGYRRRDGGEIRVLGLDPGRQRPALKPRIGIVLQSIGVEPYLTVAETVRMYARYYPHPRPLGAILATLGLDRLADRRVNRLSGGQKRRLDMAIALVGDPELLFLDEPTTGFDPAARREAWEAVRGLASLGKTVVLTTHFMDEAQYLADRVAVMAAGRVIAEGPPATLGLRARAAARITFALAGGLAPPGPTGWSRHGERWTAETDDPVGVLHGLTGWAIDHGVALDGLEVTRPSLEEVYLELIGDRHHSAAAPLPGDATR